MTPVFKRGATFEMTVTWAEGTTPISLAGCTITSQARDMRGDLVAEFEIKERDDAGGVVVFVPKVAYPTSRWPLTEILIDVKLVMVGGTVVPTETVKVQVVKEVTL